MTAVSHPAWAGARLRGVLRRRRQLGVDRDEVFRSYAPYARSEREVLAFVTGAGEDGCEALLADLWLPAREADDRSEWGSRVPLLGLLDLIVAALRPQHVVETGVERGYTSSVILHRLARNGRGVLHSIDMPPARWHPRRAVGSAVPPELRADWDLRLGPSRRLLPRLLEELGAIDVFLHDADHSRPAQLEEFRVAWPRLRTGGVLVCDDVCSDALLVFAAAAGVEPQVIVRERFGDVFGVLVKR